MPNPLSEYGYSDNDYRSLVGMLAGEALGQGVRGYASVVDVVKNRMDAGRFQGRQYGRNPDRSTPKTVSEVVEARRHARSDLREFDALVDPATRGTVKAAFQAALNPERAARLSPSFQKELGLMKEAAVGVLGTGKLAGITQGATDYLNPVVAQNSEYHRSLAANNGSMVIGDHLFTGRGFRPDQPFDPLNLNIPNPIPDLPGPLPTALNPEIPTPNVPDVPSLAGWGFPADLGQVPDVPAPFDEGVPVARGQMAGNALFDAITDARIGSPLSEVTPQPGTPFAGWGYPDVSALPDVPHAGADVARAVANEIKDQQERERRAEREIDRMVAANMPPDVGTPSLPGVHGTSPFGFANGTAATNPGALPALGVDMPERQMEAAIRDQRIKDLEEGRFARGFGTLGPDIERMNADLMAELSRPATTATSATSAAPPVDLAPEVSVAPAIARATPSATVGAPTTPQAAPTPRAAAAPAPARPTPAPALPAPVEIAPAPRVFSGPPPLDDVAPTAGTYPNPAKAPSLGFGFGSGTFGLPEGMLPGALMGGLFGGPVGALLGGLGGWGLGSLFGDNNDPAFGTPGAMSPFGSPFDDLGMAMPHDRHMGSLAEAQAFADSQSGWGGFGGLGDVFGGFGGRNEFGGIVDSGFGLGPESFDNPRDPTGSDYRG